MYDNRFSIEFFKRVRGDVRVYDSLSTHPRRSVYRGTLLECEAYVRLRSSGIIGIDQTL